MDVVRIEECVYCGFVVCETTSVAFEDGVYVDEHGASIPARKAVVLDAGDSRRVKKRLGHSEGRGSSRCFALGKRHGDRLESDA